MEFYQSISSYYDTIFPLNSAQIEFIRKSVASSDQSLRLLDAGCATGSLAIELAQHGDEVWAFDFDEEMILLAKQKKKQSGLSNFPVITQLDMRRMGKHYLPHHFDAVFCFGNTLVHLLNDADILSFLRGAFNILRNEGKLLIQILNYDFILSENIKRLPLIDNNFIRFDRNYSYPFESGLIDFNTRLTIKQSGAQIENTVPLNPLRKNHLEQLLSDVGFGNISFYGGFDAGALQPTSLPLIAVAGK